MTGNRGESFAEILLELNPRGGSGKLTAQSLKNRQR